LLERTDWECIGDLKNLLVHPNSRNCNTRAVKTCNRSVCYVGIGLLGGSRSSNQHSGIGRRKCDGWSFGRDPVAGIEKAMMMPMMTTAERRSL
jgi:hypothetical protein